MAERAGESRGAALAVLAKAPIPGFAKTRLVPRLGAEGAAELHGLLLARTLETARASGFARVALWCAPDRRAPGLAAIAAGSGVELRDQPQGDLGDRMLAIADAHLATSAAVVLVGADCPELTPTHLREARAALAGGADAVILPAHDGGYAALGLARLDRSLFDGVPWGTAEVLATTRARLQRLGWSAAELAPVRDVDLPEDVDWLLASGLLSRGDRDRIAARLR